MSQIRRQSLFSSAFIYLGFALGLLNFMFLFPNLFSREEFGLTRILLDLAQTLSAFCGVGVGVLFRFNVYYQQRYGPKQNDLLTWLFCLSLGLFVLVALGFSTLYQANTSNPLLKQYQHLVLWLTFFMLVFAILESYAFIIGRSVLPNLLKEFGFRVYTTGLIVLVYLDYIGFDWFVHLFVSFHTLAAVVLAIYLRAQKELYFVPKLSPLTRRIYPQLLYFLALVSGSYIFGILAQTLDGIIITKVMGLSYTAVFSIADYMSRLLLVPQRAISGAVFSILAAAWKSRDYARLQDIYYKSALLQLMAGLFLLGNIWLNIDFILSFLPESYAEGKYLILLLCIAKVIELGTGCNSELLFTSRYWKINLLTYLFLIAFIVPANILFIHFFGLIGSGMAAVLSYSLFNGMRYLLIRHKTGMSPFSRYTLYTLLLGAAAYLLVFWWPNLSNPWLDLMLRGGIFSLLYLGGILYFQLSEDVSKLWQKFYSRLRAR